MLGRLCTRARERYEEHRDFTLLALLFASFRFLSLLLFEPGGYILDWSGYYVPGASFVQLSDFGYYPAVHYWMEYPPVFPWLSVFVYRLSLFLPSWRDPNLWFNLLLGGSLLVFEIGNLFLVYAIADRLRGREGAVRCAWLYAGLFFPLMTLMYWFENLPLFFLLLGTYLMIARRPIGAGLATGIGFMTKFVPVLIAPTALRVFPRMSQKVAYAAAASLVVLAITLPFLVANASFFLTPFLHLGSIGSWQTIWALLDGNFAGGETTPLESRFDLATVTTTYHDTRLPYPLIAVAFVVVLLVLYSRRIDWQDNQKALSFCGLTICLFLLFSKGYSPQWIVNLLPFVLLLLPDLRGVAYSLLLMAANVLEFPIALVLIAEHSWLFVLAVLYRTLLLVILSSEFGVLLFPSPKRQMVQKALLVSVILLSIVGALPTGVLALQSYAAERHQEFTYREPIDYLSSQPAGAVFFTDQRLYQQSYSFLAAEQGMYLVEANEGLPKTLALLVGEHSSLYVIYAGSEDDQRSNPAVEGYLSQHAFPTTVQWFDNARVTRYSTAGSGLQEHVQQTSFAGQFELAACSFDRGPLQPGGVLRVSLSWRSLRPAEKDYTVFVHLVDEDERVWAQHDGQPVGGFRPTSSWQPGDQIFDNHGLVLPSDIPPGEYLLAAGLYETSTGKRLAVATGEPGTQSDKVLVGPVLVGVPAG